jgi:hypothetical protein
LEGNAEAVALSSNAFPAETGEQQVAEVYLRISRSRFRGWMGLRGASHIEVGLGALLATFRVERPKICKNTSLVNPVSSSSPQKNEAPICELVSGTFGHNRSGGHFPKKRHAADKQIDQSSIRTEEHFATLTKAYEF